MSSALCEHGCGLRSGLAAWTWERGSLQATGLLPAAGSSPHCPPRATRGEEPAYKQKKKNPKCDATGWHWGPVVSEMSPEGLFLLKGGTLCGPQVSETWGCGLGSPGSSQTPQGDLGKGEFRQAAGLKTHPLLGGSQWRPPGGGGGLRGGAVAVLLLSFIHRELRWEGDRTGQADGSPEAGGPGGHHRQRPLDKTAAGPALPGRFCGAASVSLDLMVSLCPGRLCRCPVGPSAQPRRSALVYVGTTEDIPRSVLEGRFRQELSCLGPLCLPWGSSLCVTRRESLGPGPLLGTLSFVHLPLPPHALLSLLSWPCPARGQKPRSLLRGGRRCPC